MPEAADTLYCNDISFDHTIYRGELNMSFYQTHDTYEMTYVMRGERTLFLYGRQFTLDQDHIALIPTEVPHKTVSSGNSDQERLCLQIKPAFFHNLLGDGANELFAILSSMPLVLELDLKEKQIVQEETNKLVGIYYARDDLLMRDLKVKASFLHLFMTLYNKIELQYTSLSAAERQAFLENDFIFPEIIAYLHENYRYRITLEQLSSRFHLSRTRLSAKLNAYLGISWVTYVNSLRIKEAQSLLDIAHNNISEIATSVGFDSLTHFERVFKQFLNQTPTQYIRRQKSVQNERKKSHSSRGKKNMMNPPAVP